MGVLQTDACQDMLKLLRILLRTEVAMPVLVKKKKDRKYVNVHFYWIIS